MSKETLSEKKATVYVANLEGLSEHTAIAPSHEEMPHSYELWIARGRGDGAAEEDWLEAEGRLVGVNRQGQNCLNSGQIS